MFEKKQRCNKIIQFGEGGFLRGFVDWIVQLTNENSDFNAGVVVVQPIEKGMCDMLEKQNCVYTHIMRGMKDGVPTVEKKVIDVIDHTVQPYKDFEEYLALADDKNFRFIVSNTTESGIAFVADDKAENAPAVSFPGKLTLLLKRRFDKKLPGFIFLPCELIDRNGENLKKCVLKYIELWNLGDDFAAWIENENYFCNTLVDRIVTGYPRDEKIDLGYEDNMLNTSELFHLWVIEGPDFLVKEFPFDKANLNIIVTNDLERYRTRKVRILNGAHTSMIPYAMLCNIESVGDCMKDEKMSAFVKKCVYEEIIPTLDLPEEELLDYANNVFERFENPYIKHLCASISLNSVSKFKVRVLPSLLEYIKRKNAMPETLLFSFAKLIEFYKVGTPNDDEKIMAYMKEASVKDILSNKDLWDEDLGYLTAEVEKYIGK
ncbi:MAG: tagaturonate reductase [Ruminococcaceae bacterium]|nr:tagaturonate reductase [Oscillospiraceae bacterium]